MVLNGSDREYDPCGTSGKEAEKMKIVLSIVCLLLCGCAVTDVPKAYQLEIKLDQPHSDDIYQFEKLNEFTFAIVNQKTGQVWECSIHDSKCSQAMYPALDPKSNKFSDFRSVPDATVAVIEK
jgi:hypothetical protein